VYRGFDGGGDDQGVGSLGCSRVGIFDGGGCMERPIDAIERRESEWMSYVPRMEAPGGTSRKGMLSQV